MRNLFLSAGSYLNSIIGVVFGLFLVSKPTIVIEVQRKLYRIFNWDIEPISMQKEIRNMRIMGVALIALALFAITFLILWKRFFRF